MVRRGAEATTEAAEVEPSRRSAEPLQAEEQFNTPRNGAEAESVYDGAQVPAKQRNIRNHDARVNN